MMLGVMGLMGILVIATVVVGDIFLHKQSRKLVSLKLDNQVIEAQQTALVQAKKDVQKYQELETIAKQIVPQDKDQARTTREIVSLADQAGVKIASITFPASTLGQKVAPTAAAGAATTPAPGAAATPSVTQVKPVDGINGLYQLDITVVSDTTAPVTYARLIDFLSRLEQNRRTSQVTQISIQPDSTNRSSLNFTLTITTYIKP
ncbi:MAG TPA: hypothetical protein VLE74_00070 [Candidatus Saccharimonadales bacterium]|nr:hypothetical protein [Candidatus Saccharimonadales bacterium]